MLYALRAEGGRHASFAVEGGVGVGPGGPLEKERRVYERGDDAVGHGQPVCHLGSRKTRKTSRERRGE